MFTECHLFAFHVRKLDMPRPRPLLYSLTLPPDIPVDNSSPLLFVDGAHCPTRSGALRCPPCPRLAGPGLRIAHPFTAMSITHAICLCFSQHVYVAWGSACVDPCISCQDLNGLFIHSDKACTGCALVLPFRLYSSRPSICFLMCYAFLFGCLALSTMR